TTVTVVEHDETFPLWSIAVYVTIVVPSGNDKVPIGPATVAVPAMSDAIAPPSATSALRLPVASAVTGAGHVIVGGVVSPTVTVVEHDDTFPLSSVAV